MPGPVNRATIWCRSFPPPVKKFSSLGFFPFPNIQTLMMVKALSRYSPSMQQFLAKPFVKVVNLQL